MLDVKCKLDMKDNLLGVSSDPHATQDSHKYNYRALNTALPGILTFKSRDSSAGVIVDNQEGTSLSDSCRKKIIIIKNEDIGV